MIAAERPPKPPPTMITEGLRERRRVILFSAACSVAMRFPTGDDSPLLSSAGGLTIDLGRPAWLSFPAMPDLEQKISPDGARASTAAIVVRDLAKSYGEIAAVRGVRFARASGRAVGFVAP